MDALVSGRRWVADRHDPALVRSALSALAKIAGVLPAELRREVHESALLRGAGTRTPCSRSPDLLRRAIGQQHKLEMTYRDAADTPSQYMVWPFALMYVAQTRVLMGWCELRQEFCNFRADQIGSRAAADSLSNTPARSAARMVTHQVCCGEKPTARN